MSPNTTFHRSAMEDSVSKVKAEVEDKENSAPKSTETGAADSSLKRNRFLLLPAPAENRVLYISRHGESTYNPDKRLGGNPDLSGNGREYARQLGIYAAANLTHLTKVGNGDQSEFCGRSESEVACILRILEMC